MWRRKHNGTGDAGASAHESAAGGHSSWLNFPYGNRKLGKSSAANDNTDTDSSVSFFSSGIGYFEYEIL